MHSHDSGVIVDGVDDSVVASPSNDQAGQVANARHARLVGVFADRAGKSDESSIANLWWQSAHMAEALGRYADLVHPDRAQIPGTGTDSPRAASTLERFKDSTSSESRKMSSVSSRESRSSGLTSTNDGRPLRVT